VTIERATVGARLVLAPDWHPITCTKTECRKDRARGPKTIESFHTHATPPLPGQQGDEVLGGLDDLSDKAIAS
jgi:catechol 2,3-dioxygenase